MIARGLDPALPNGGRGPRLFVVERRGLRAAILRAGSSPTLVRVTPRERILARRAQFVGASLAALACEACAAQPSRGSSGAPSTSATAPSSDATTDAMSDAMTDAMTQSEADAPETEGAADAAALGDASAAKVVVRVCLSIIIMERPAFATGSAKLLPETAPLLDAAAEVLKAHPEIEELTITGHCDAVEKPCPDEARAESVRAALVTRGVQDSRLTTAHAGSSEPLADNATPEGRRKNRRAEWKVTRKKP